MPCGKRVEFGASLPSAVRFQLAQQSSMLTYVCVGAAAGGTEAQQVGSVLKSVRKRNSHESVCKVSYFAHLHTMPSR